MFGTYTPPIPGQAVKEGRYVYSADRLWRYSHNGVSTVFVHYLVSDWWEQPARYELHARYLINEESETLGWAAPSLIATCRQPRLVVAQQWFTIHWPNIQAGGL